MRKRDWASLPSEILVSILSGNDDNMKTFVAVSGVCRDWRRSSEWVSLIKWNDMDTCRKHGDVGCNCLLDSFRSIISRLHSVNTVNLIGSVESTQILESCKHWSSWSSKLEQVSLDFPSPRLCEEISSCKAITMLDLKDLGENILRPLVLSNLRKIHLSGVIPDEASLRQMLQYCVNLQELWIHSHPESATVEEFSLHAPRKLEVLDITLGLPVLRVYAPSVPRMSVSFVDKLYIEAADRLEELTLRFETTLASKGPPSLRKLDLHHFQESPMEALYESVCYVPNLRSLRVTCRLVHWPWSSEPASRLFFEALGKVPELEELELNFDVVVQMIPVISEVNLPKLRVLALDLATTELSNYASTEEEAKSTEAEKEERDGRFTKPLLDLLAALPHVKTELKQLSKAPSRLLKLFKQSSELMHRFPSLGNC